MEYLTGSRSFSRRAVLSGLVAASASLALATPASAYAVVISPSSPQLGDTISVIVQASQPGGAPPTVIVNQDQQYPTFPLSGNRFRAFIPTSPLQAPGTLTIQVVGDEGSRNLAVGLRNRTFPTQRITLSSSQNPAGTQHEFDRVAAFKALVTPERFWRGAMVRPNPGRVTTVYGVRRYYNGAFASDYYHRGVDYAAPTGSPVVAPAAGRIALVGRVNQGFSLHGNTVGIDHGQGVLSIMIHLHRINVNEGDLVQAGQVIGTVGSTGISTGPHLHWGLYVNGVSVDPVPWRERGFE
jgi:murein DD-endopeptidase MepM/ murein hydrolase activator NlpD